MPRTTPNPTGRPAAAVLARRAGLFVLGTALALVGLAAPAAAADAPAAPVLRYSADWTDTVEGVIEANKPVVVDFALERLPKCRNQYAGGDAWGISVEYRVDGGAVQRKSVTELNADRRNDKVPAVLDLPLGARELELWFVSGDRAGCREYDSRYGANYRYAIGQPAVATFGADWSETVAGQVRAGRSLVVRYDTARLPQCRETYNGMTAWQIEVFYRFDGGPAQSRAVTDSTGQAAPTSIDLPPSARRVEVWFRVYGQRSGCTAVDSDYGRNYGFTAA